MKQYIQAIANRMIHSTETIWPMNIHCFDWVPGVGLYGIWKAYEYTKNSEYLEFLVKWIDQHLQEAYQQKTVNSTAPMLTVFNVYCVTKNEIYLKTCIDISDYIVNKAPRTRENGLEHTVTEADASFSEQIWADTLFMVCIFIAKLGVFLKNDNYIQFATEQLKIHHTVLADPISHLYYHGWNCKAENHMSGVCWGRANAWILYSTMEIYNTIGDFEGADTIKEYIKKHVTALARVQNENGGFCTVLDDVTAYVEISATAGISAGIKMAVDKGIAEKEYLENYKKAVHTVIEAILPDGAVDGVSSGTPVMPDVAAYKSIPCQPTLYGQALAILALL